MTFQKRKKAFLLFGTLFASFAWGPPLAQQQPQSVDLELVIATDNSQSIDRVEAALQRRGIAAAFQAPEVVRAIQSGSLGRIGVAYVDWSSAPYTRVVLNWRIIQDKASADAFADALLKAPPPFGQGTAIGEAIAFAAALIEANNLQGTKRTIDVSGDGPNNTGRPAAEARDEIIAKGIAVNGLPILSDEYGTGDWGAYYGDLAGYYANCVIGGPGSFAVPTKSFQDFATAIRRKLVLEISNDLPATTPRPRASLLVKAAAGLNDPLLPMGVAQPPPVLRPPTLRNQAPDSRNCTSYLDGRRGFRF